MAPVYGLKELPLRSDERQKLVVDPQNAPDGPGYEWNPYTDLSHTEEPLWEVRSSGLWMDPSTLTFGGIDGEEFMGTGTAFSTDEAGPVYSPPS